MGQSKLNFYIIKHYFRQCSVV